MSKRHLYFKSADGITRIHTILWRPEGEIKAVLQLVHGMAEYIDRYHEFAVYLNSKGIAVIGHDHLGHGESVLGSSRLGFFAEKKGYRCVIQDMHSVTKIAHKLFPGKDVFILGHSMGSFMTRYYLSGYSKDVAGAVIMGTGSVPAPVALFGANLARVIALVKGKKYPSALLTDIALGSYNKHFEQRTSVDWLSRNEENVDRYDADPLCGFIFTASAYQDFFTVMAKLGNPKTVAKVRKDLPVLIVSGELDPVGGAAACPKVRAEYIKAGLTDVEMIIYEDDRHEILNEVDRDQVYRDIEEWILSR